jgi:translation initiation factor 2 subunit 2
MTFKHKYEDMLNKAYKELPESKSTNSRFEIPKFHGRLQGSRTILTNFSQIASTLRRNINHMFKFIVSELATTGEIRPNQVIFNGKFAPTLLNTKLEKYTKEFVLCDQCNKPDTELIKEKDLTFKRCEACGAKHSVRTIK